jgi:hypothetical protein
MEIVQGEKRNNTVLYRFMCLLILDYEAALSGCLARSCKYCVLYSIPLRTGGSFPKSKSDLA